MFADADFKSAFALLKYINIFDLDNFDPAKYDDNAFINLVIGGGDGLALMLRLLFWVLINEKVQAAMEKGLLFPNFKPSKLCYYGSDGNIQVMIGDRPINIAQEHIHLPGTPGYISKPAMAHLLRLRRGATSYDCMSSSSWLIIEQFLSIRTVSVLVG